MNQPIDQLEYGDNNIISGDQRREEYSNVMQIKNRYQAVKQSYDNQSSSNTNNGRTEPVTRSGSACDQVLWKEDNLNGSMDYVPKRANTKLKESHEMSIISAEGGRYRDSDNLLY